MDLSFKYLFILLQMPAQFYFLVRLNQSHHLRFLPYKSSPPWKLIFPCPGCFPYLQSVAVGG